MCDTGKTGHTGASRPLSCLLQEKQDVLPDVLRLGARVVSHEGLPALGDEELLPVPADVLGPDGVVVQVGRVGECLARGGAVRLREQTNFYHHRKKNKTSDYFIWTEALFIFTFQLIFTGL